MLLHWSPENWDSRVDAFGSHKLLLHFSLFFTMKVFLWKYSSSGCCWYGMGNLEEGWNAAGDAIFLLDNLPPRNGDDKIRLNINSVRFSIDRARLHFFLATHFSDTDSHRVQWCIAKTLLLPVIHISNCINEMARVECEISLNIWPKYKFHFDMRNNLLLMPCIHQHIAPSRIGHINYLFAPFYMISHCFCIIYESWRPYGVFSRLSLNSFSSAFSAFSAKSLYFPDSAWKRWELCAFSIWGK